MVGLKDLMQQAQNLQAKAMEIQDSLRDKTVTGNSGGDMVTVVASGAQEILEIKIDPDLLSENDTEMLEDLITAAVNDALAKAKAMAEQEMSKLAGGLKIPGLF
jgi:hypothetical protein